MAVIKETTIKQFNNKQFNTMKIQDQAVVTMTYVLRENDENGPILQETTKENPFVAIFGMHQLLPKFEENLMGK